MPEANHSGGGCCWLRSRPVRKVSTKNGVGKQELAFAPRVEMGGNSAGCRNPVVFVARKSVLGVGRSVDGQRAARQVERHCCPRRRSEWPRIRSGAIVSR